MNGLALAEQIRVFAAGGLGRFEPLQSRSFGSGDELDGEFLSALRKSHPQATAQNLVCLSKFKTQGISGSIPGRNDIQIPGIKIKRTTDSRCQIKIRLAVNSAVGKIHGQFNVHALDAALGQIGV